MRAPKHPAILFLVIAMTMRVQSLAQTGAEAGTWSWGYRLLESSYFADDCPICGRPTIMIPLRGGFTLAPVNPGATNAVFALQNLALSAAGFDTNSTYLIEGEGTCRFGPDQRLEEMVVRARINNSSNPYVFVLDHNVPQPRLSWPMLSASLVETQQATFTKTFHLDILAAPIRELWFSIGHGLTDSQWSTPTNGVTPGDLVSDTGRIVRSRAELLESLKLTSDLSSVGIDAVDIAPGGEILFSLDKDATNEAFGRIQHGDLLGDRRGIIKRNQALVAAFLPKDTNADYGLDAVQVMTNGEIYFSITTDLASSKAGDLFRGDILSDQGRVVKSNQQLLARLQPRLADHDFGLDALYIWPSGEIWFSTEEGFESTSLGSIQSGDLLSDQGYVVGRNLSLVSGLSPVEDLADFGIDALYVVTDAIPGAPAPRLLLPIADSSVGSLELRWNGPGRVFQVEKAIDAAGPFTGASPLIAGTNWFDPDTLDSSETGFYRLKQW